MAYAKVQGTPWDTDLNSTQSQTTFMAVDIALDTVLWTTVLRDSKSGSDGHQDTNVKGAHEDSNSDIRRVFQNYYTIFCWWFYIWKHT